MVDLILASASPRRRELLQQMGLRLRIQPANIDETPHPHEKPHAYVGRVAREKCLALVRTDPNQVTPILSADTSVILGEAILGKPQDGEDAGRMLQQLSGGQHEVATAFCISFRGQIVEQMVSTKVEFRSLDPREIEAYVQSREWEGKAGGYAIQDRAAAFVTQVMGSVTNVIGLPLSEVLVALRELGALPNYPPAGYGAVT